MDQSIKAAAERCAEACFEEACALLRSLGKIPAPTRREERRAAFCRDWLLANGAKELRIDGANNVICPIGPQDGPLTVFAAHTDVVFPDLEPLPMREENGILYAPGVGDDTANLVNLLLSARWLLQHHPDCPGGLLIVANACEEGLGNLDGTKAVFAAYGDRIRAFYSFDCDLPQIIHRAVGSYRYRIHCRTAGGHSYGAFGAPNAIEILCRLVEKLYAVEPPGPEKTTYNVGRFEGGTTVNSIAQEASMLYEFRSASQRCLEQMEQIFRRTLESCRTPGCELRAELLGVRPGSGPVDPQKLERFTARSVEAVECFWQGRAELLAASTDSNVPLSLGIPANTLGTVRGGGAHSREEWVELASLKPGLKIALSLMLQAALQPELLFAPPEA